MYATYQKAWVRVKDITLLGTTIKNENNVHNLFMVDALVIITNSKHVKNVNTFVLFLILWV